MYYTCLFFESWFFLLLLFSSYKCLLIFLHVWPLVNSLLFGYYQNELVLFHFLSNELGLKSTLYFSCKSIEVSCETDRSKAFAISAASVRFLILMNFSRRFAIKSGVTFWDGLICKSQKQLSITIINLFLIGTKRNQIFSHPFTLDIKLMVSDLPELSKRLGRQKFQNCRSL